MPDTAVRSVAIAVLTYRRPDDISAALPLLTAQAQSVDPSAWTAKIIVVDNDPDAGAREFVTGFAASSAAGGISIDYQHEPVPGITAGRNRALDSASEDDVLVFIDDDERPTDQWLTLLLGTFVSTGSTSVAGRVISEYEAELTPWMVAGEFFKRRRLATGTAITVAATNNLLLDLHFVREKGLRFDAKFGISGGGDSLFTRQLIRSGGTMVWNDEAIVVDVVPAKRSTPKWVLQRALRSGNTYVRALLHVASSPLERLSIRVKATGEGLVRVIGGGLRAVLGAVTRNLTHRAKGARTFSRGAGMLLGVVGYTHSEYRRKK